jgi:hypothetical protein
MFFLMEYGISRLRGHPEDRESCQPMPMIDVRVGGHRRSRPRYSYFGLGSQVFPGNVGIRVTIRRALKAVCRMLAARVGGHHRES